MKNRNFNLCTSIKYKIQALYSSHVSNASISSIISVVVVDEVVVTVVEVAVDETAVVASVDEVTKNVSAVVESVRFWRTSMVGEVLVDISVVLLVVVQSSRLIVETVSVMTTLGLLVPFATVENTAFTVVVVQSFSSGIYNHQCECTVMVNYTHFNNLPQVNLIILKIIKI